MLRRSQKWNGGELPPKYYAGGTAQPAASRTRHVWGFANRLSQARAQPSRLRAARDQRAPERIEPPSRGAGRIRVEAPGPGCNQPGEPRMRAARHARTSGSRAAAREQSETALTLLSLPCARRPPRAPLPSRSPTARPRPDRRLQSDKAKLDDTRDSVESQTAKAKPNTHGLSVAAARREQEAARGANGGASAAASSAARVAELKAKEEERVNELKRKLGMS